MIKSLWNLAKWIVAAIIAFFFIVGILQLSVAFGLAGEGAIDSAQSVIATQAARPTNTPLPPKTFIKAETVVSRVKADPWMNVTILGTNVVVVSEQQNPAISAFGIDWINLPPTIVTKEVWGVASAGYRSDKVGVAVIQDPETGTVTLILTLPPPVFIGWELCSENLTRRCQDANGAKYSQVVSIVQPAELGPVSVGSLNESTLNDVDQKQAQYSITQACETGLLNKTNDAAPSALEERYKGVDEYGEPYGYDVVQVATSQPAGCP